ncbi:MAG: paraquat-inducible protein A [Pseudomonadota bacterium]
MKSFASTLLVISALSLPLGLTLPVMEFKRLYFLSTTPSIIDIIASVWNETDYAIAALIFVVSIFFPLLKLLVIGLQIASDGNADAGPTARLVNTFSKWSMLDVMLVAIAIFAAKTTGLASAVTKPGICFFAISAITATLAAHIVSKDRTRA